jgi:type I restriction enzyme, S subunit
MPQSYQYIELSFINDSEEIKRQIINTVAIAFLLNEGYEATSLSTYLDSTQYGYTASATDNGTHQLLRITDINSGVVNWKSVPYCNCGEGEKYLLKENDVLVARTGGTTGKSFLIKKVPSNAIFASYLIRLRANKKALPEFISIFLNSYVFWSQISELKSGSAQPNVNAEKLKTLSIPECPISIQQKVIDVINGLNTSRDNFSLKLNENIAYVLSILNSNDELKKELEQQQTYLQLLRQTILQEAVQGKLIKQDPKEEPATELLKRIKAEKESLIKEGKLKKERELPPVTEDEIPFELPKGWVWCRLGTFTNNVDYGTSEKASETGEIPILRMGNVQEGLVLVNNLKYVRKSIKDLPRLYLKKRDIVFNRTNSYELVGKCGIFEGEDDEYTLASYLIRMSIPHHLVSVDYVNYYINSTVCRATQIEPQITQQTGQANFSGSKLKEILFPLPPFSEQERIVAKVQDLQQQLSRLEAQIGQSRQYAHQLLQMVLKEAFASREEKYVVNEEVSLAAEEEINYNHDSRLL